MGVRMSEGRKERKPLGPIGLYAVEVTIDMEYWGLGNLYSQTKLKWGD